MLAVYFVYFMVVRSETVINNSYNARTKSFAETTVRGSILADDETVLASSSVDSEGNETRSYAYGRMFSHVIGYSFYGGTGVEEMANFYLLRSHEFTLERLYHELSDEKKEGDNVVTTLNVEVQKAAYDALGSHNGAVVVLQPSTGKILAMVSKPDYDPNTLYENWDSVVSDSNSSVLLNRATQGQYPPGSVFKIFTTLAYAQDNSSYKNYSYTCNGEISADGSTIHCAGNTAHGEEDLMSSFAHSCNTSYANIGLKLKIDTLREVTKKALFNSELPLAFEYEKSSFSLDNDASDSTIMQTVIGQGTTLVSPMHMAMVAAAIDNDGLLITPYVVDHTTNNAGVTVKNFSTTPYGELFSESDVKLLQKYMRAVVTDGTGSALNGQSYTASGKTGSAENGGSKDATHAWFVGYASKDGYEDIAIAVIVEEAGSGSKYAVPVAKAVFDAYFN
jgi:peptidoglycan glycosyltransferase